jgi:hypothetical protein
MPIQDAEMMLMDAQSIAANSGQTVTGESVVYIPQVKNHKGTAIDDSPNNSGRLYWNVVVENTSLAAASDSASVTIALYVDTDSTPTAGGTAILSKTLTIAQTETTYVDGKQVLSMALPMGQLDQYFGVLVTVATQNLTAGALTSWIGGPVQQGS